MKRPKNIVRTHGHAPEKLLSLPTQRHRGQVKLRVMSSASTVGTVRITLSSY